MGRAGVAAAPATALPLAKPASDFRVYHSGEAAEGPVEAFYRENHERQTYDFVEAMEVRTRGRGGGGGGAHQAVRCEEAQKARGRTCAQHPLGLRPGGGENVAFAGVLRELQPSCNCTDP